LRQRCRRVVNDNSPSFLRKEVEKSLKRLRTDYIDLLYKPGYAKGCSGRCIEKA